MATQVQTTDREAVLVEPAHVRPMMGIEVLEPVPARNVPYELSDPYILVHEATVPINPERAKLDTTHPHRGFDNLWYILSGSASTGHSTGPGGTFERARLDTGSLLKIRTGRGVYHAENIGEDELREGKTGEFRSVLFWVNLARKEKQSEPTAQVVDAGRDIPTRTRWGYDDSDARRAGSGGGAGHAGTHPRRRARGWRRLQPGDRPGVQCLRLDARGRGGDRHQWAPRRPIRDRGSRPWWGTGR